jgi:non-specific serine/threonine protein kinase
MLRHGAEDGMAANGSSTFGAQLRQYRVAAGLTQNELARQAGVSARGIQDLELGVRLVPHQVTAERLADALGLPPAERAVFCAVRRRLGPRFRFHGGSSQAAVAELSATDVRLPISLTSFVGRARELLELEQLLLTTRLLTLVGPGGVGKTRLALEVAHVSAGKYGAGVTLVELAPVADPSLVPQAIASALEVEEQPGRTLVRTLHDTLRSQELLLLLDNCEHLLQPCAELTKGLLRACPALTILVTSREPLGLGGEITWRVPSLSLPPLQPQMSLEQLGQSEAVCLFVQRAALRQPSFKLTSGNAPAVAQICRQLDGIPLAVELAAARVHALSVEQIADRLNNSLRLLTGGSSTSPPRQRTLRGTLDWSFGLLAGPEQVLLRRLAVFAGGCTLEAAEAVCPADDLRPNDVLDLLAHLVDKSLVIADLHGGVAWYRTLDTVRTYAWEKLQASGEDVVFRCRHRDWYLQYAERFFAEFHGPRQRTLLEAVEREEANFRAALRWCLDHDDANEGLRIGVALNEFWQLRGHEAEGREWLTKLLAVTGGPVPERVRADALRAAGLLAVYQMDYEAADVLLKESLTLWRKVHDARGIALTLGALGTAANFRGDLAQAQPLLMESLALSQVAGDRVRTAITFNALAKGALQQGDLFRAEALWSKSLELRRQQGDSYMAAHDLYGLAYLAWTYGHAERAITLVREALAIWHDLAHTRRIGYCLDLLGEICSSQGDAVRSARLLGAAEALREHYGGRRSVEASLPVACAHREVSLASVRASLTADAFATHWAEGRALPLADAVALGLEISAGAVAAASVRSGAVGQQMLSRRESDVLRLIAEGKSNREIAALLVLSLRTVERHTSNLYAKLGAGNRAAAAVYAVRNGVLASPKLQ